jgi:flagellar protein FliS
MASFNPYQRYLNVQYETVDQGALILMTYDGAIRFCHSAEQCLTADDKVGKGMWLTKAFDAVGELRKSLRPESGGDTAKYLDQAYSFVCTQLTMANVTGRTEHIQNALQVLETLRDAWREIVREYRRQSDGLALTG